METIVQQDVNDAIEANPELMEQLTDSSFLVTGSTGMIGQYTVCLLAENARRNNGSGMVIANARNRDKAEQMFASYLGDEKFELLISDVNNITSLESDVDYIIHAASPTQPQDFQERPVDIINANVFTTRNLLEVAKQKVARFCLLSSLEAYGEIEAGSYPVKVTEEDYGRLDSLALRSSYPESKRLAENLCVAYKEQFNVESTVVRLAPAVSPIVSTDDKRVFAQFINDATSGRDITVYSDVATKKRSYTHVADVVTGILTAVTRSTSDNFVFNLANNDSLASIKELAEKAIEHSGNKSSLNVVNRDDNSNTSATTGLVLLDSQKLLDLGWVPKYTLDDSIKQAVKYKTDQE